MAVEIRFSAILTALGTALSDLGAAATKKIVGAFNTLRDDVKAQPAGDAQSRAMTKGLTRLAAVHPVASHAAEAAGDELQERRGTGWGPLQCLEAFEAHVPQFKAADADDADAVDADDAEEDADEESTTPLRGHKVHAQLHDGASESD